MFDLMKKFIIQIMQNYVKEIKINSLDIEILTKEGKRERFIKEDVEKMLKNN